MSETKSLRGGLTRRTFLKTTAAAAGAAAISGGGTLTALANDETDNAGVEEQVFYNFCRGNCGSSVCRQKGIVREGKLVQVRTLPTDEGHEDVKTSCVKGQINPQRIYSPTRVLYPMKRVDGTERGEGQWERITWDEAIGIISQKFVEAQKQYGDASCAFWHGYAENGLLNLGASYAPIRPRGGSGIGLERVLQATGATVLTPAADLGQMYSQFNLLNYVANSVPDIVNCKTMLIWGSNPTDASRQSWQYIIEAKERGMRMITIDPRFTGSAARSEMWLPIRPATDGLLALAMCNYVVDHDLIDYDYMKNSSVGPLLIKADGKYLHMADLDSSDPATADDFVVYDEKAKAFGSSKKIKDPALWGAFDVKLASGETAKVRTVWDYVYENIKEYTVERAAEECDLPIEKIEYVAHLYATNKPSIIGTFEGLAHHYNSWHTQKDIVLLGCLTGNVCKPGAGVMMPNYYNEDNTIGANYDTSALIQVENAKPSVALTGMNLPEIMETGKFGGKAFPIRWIYNFQGNPLASDSGRTALIEAIKKVDFVVTHDTFLSDTARYSDIVLPCTMSWEAEDCNGGYSLLEKAIEPAGESKSNIEVFRLLAAGIGFPNLFDKTDEEYLRIALDTPFNRENGLTYDDFKKKRLIRKYKDPYTVGVEYNPTGRTQFYVEYVQCKDDHGIEIDQDTNRRPYYEHALEAYAENPLFEKYPFYGDFYHNNYTVHSMIPEVPWLDELRPEPVVEINTKAAEDRGIEDGDMVRVYNDRGYVVLRAKLTNGIRPDVVMLPHGWQSYDYVDGHHQDLTRVDLDPVCGNSSFNDFLCNVEKYEGSVK